MLTSKVVFILAAILIIAALLFLVIILTKKSPARLDVERYRIDWLKIEQKLQRDDVSSYHLSVLNGDKLVDRALKERGVRGATMGERMKNNKDVWTSRNNVWEAHKLRNRIAHESDVSVGYDEARRALAGFKQALKDLGAI